MLVEDEWDVIDNTVFQDIDISSLNIVFDDPVCNNTQNEGLLLYLIYNYNLN